MSEPFSIVILAGGASERMGRPKALLPFGPETLVERAVRRLEPLAEDLVVVVGPHVDLPPLAAARVVIDAEPLRGPAAGIGYGLRAAEHDVALVCAADLPFVRLALLGLISQNLGNNDGAMPRWGGYAQPLIAAYQRRLAATFEAIARSDSPRAVAILERARIRELAAEEISAVDPDGRSFFDVDTPAAYQQALALRSTWDD